MVDKPRIGVLENHFLAQRGRQTLKPITFFFWDTLHINNKILFYSGEHCEAAEIKKCAPKTFKEPGVNFCGPCDCRPEKNFNETCDPDGKIEPWLKAGKCFCNVSVYFENKFCTS